MAYSTHQDEELYLDQQANDFDVNLLSADSNEPD